MSLFVTQLQPINIYKIDIEGDKYTDFIYENIENGNINRGRYKYLFNWFFDILILDPTQITDLYSEITDFIKNIDSVKDISITYRTNIIEHFGKIQSEIEVAIKNKYYLQMYLC